MNLCRCDILHYCFSYWEAVHTSWWDRKLNEVDPIYGARKERWVWSNVSLNDRSQSLEFQSGRKCGFFTLFHLVHCPADACQSSVNREKLKAWVQFHHSCSYSQLVLVSFPHVQTILRIINDIWDRLLAIFPTIRYLSFTWVRFTLWIYTEVCRCSWTDPVLFLCSQVAIKNVKCARSASSELPGWWSWWEESGLCCTVAIRN